MYIVTRFIISSSFPKLDERNFGQGIADTLTLQNTSDPTMEIDFKMVVVLLSHQIERQLSWRQSASQRQDGGSLASLGSKIIFSIVSKILNHQNQWLWKVQQCLQSVSLQYCWYNRVFAHYVFKEGFSLKYFWRHDFLLYLLPKY
jgi:hypothetical protein